MIARAMPDPDGAIGRVTFVRARALLAAAAEPLPAESLALERAGGRIAVETLHAGEDLVPFARSAMDGYAVRAIDTLPATSGAVSLPVATAAYAGDAPEALPHGTAFAIATGAPLPNGADAVVPFENVVRGADAIELRAAVAPGEHVFQPGDDARRGDVLVRAGDTLTAGRIALLAAAGHARIAVRRRPRVAIVSTGNELVAIGDRPPPGKIRNSNAAMLAAFAARDGAEIVFETHAADSRSAVDGALREALARADVVITSGGASVGERDYVKKALAALGAAFAFDSVALRPAKPAAFARAHGRLIAVLPGNPAAAYVGYATLARGLVRGLAGAAPAYPPLVPALLQGTIHRKDHRTFVMFAELALRDGRLVVRPLENQCSSLTRTAADANALIVVEPGTGYVRAGDAVAVDVLDWDAVALAAPGAC